MTEVSASFLFCSVFPPLRQQCPERPSVAGVAGIGRELHLLQDYDSIGSLGANIIQKAAVIRFQFGSLKSIRVLQPFNENFQSDGILVVVARPPCPVRLNSLSDRFAT
jgi:hypothetical protein